MKTRSTLPAFLLLLLGCLVLIYFHEFPKGHPHEPEEATDMQSVKEPEATVDEGQDDMAMENSSHLKFKGVPIDGTLKKFKSRMIRKGFKHLSMQEGTEVLEGDFADFKRCLIYVSTLDNKDLVSKISVEFPGREEWSELYGDYKHLKGLLVEKYGRYSSCTEKFQSYGGIESDFLKMHSLKMGECRYQTVFNLKNGSIRLQIKNRDMGICFVMLTYQDKENGAAVKEHAKNDL